MADKINNRYLINHRIGGETSDVYSVRDQVLEKDVVLKLYHKPVRPQNISSPYALQIIDSGILREKDFVVTEKESSSLEKEILAGMTYPEIVNYMQQLLQGIGTAHKSGRLHQGLKSSRVLLSDHRVRVSDFGIRTDNPEYSAPELLQGGQPSIESDLYAAAVIFYECIAGRKPFFGDTPATVIGQQISIDPVPVSEANPRIKKDTDISDYRVVDEIIKKALDKDPEKRYRSAEEFRDAIIGSAIAKKKSKAPWIAVAIFLVLLAGFGVYKILSGETATDVPDYRGERIETVIKEISGKNWEYGISEQTSSLQPGLVIDQSPIGSVTPPFIIQLTVSQQILSMPNLINQNLLEAKTKLEKIDIDYEIKKIYSSVKPNTILKTIPAPGTELSEGDSVQLIVSRGSELVLVPDLIGLTEEAAEQKLLAVGLDYQIVSGLSGYVVSQTEGRIPASQKVKLSLEATPDLIGLSEDEATEKMLRLGISYTIYEEPTDIDSDGIVIAQTPNPGDEIQNMEITVGRLEP